MDDGLRLLTDAERKRRYAVLRGFLDENGLDALFVCGDGAVAWIAGEFLRYPDAFVLFPREGEPALFVSNAARRYVLYGLEKNRSDFWIQDYHVNGPAQLRAVLSARLPKRCRLGITGRGMSQDMIRALQDAAPGAELTEVTQAYQRLRRVKSREDILLLRHCVQVVDETVSELGRTLHAGMHENEVKAVMERAMYAAGAHDTLNLCNADPQDISFVSMPGDHCAAQLRPGDLLCCEVTACFHQMWTQQIVHVSLGEPSPAFRRLHDACRMGHDAAAAMIRPGVNARDMMNEGCRIIEAAGFLSGRQFMSGPPGHLVGFERDEGTFSCDEDLILEEGMALNLHLSAAVPGWQPGQPAVFGPGSAFLVTGTGGERLNSWPNDILVC